MRIKVTVIESEWKPNWIYMRTINGLHINHISVWRWKRQWEALEVI